MKLGEAVYKSQQTEQNPKAESQQESKKEDVVDAEYEEVNNKEG